MLRIARGTYSSYPWEVPLDQKVPATCGTCTTCPLATWCISSCPFQQVTYYWWYVKSYVIIAIYRLVLLIVSVLLHTCINDWFNQLINDLWWLRMIDQSLSQTGHRTPVQYYATRTFYLLLISFPIKEREPLSQWHGKTGRAVQGCLSSGHDSNETSTNHLLCPVLPGPKGTLTAFPGPQWIHARSSTQWLDGRPPLSSNVRCWRWTRRDQTFWKHVPTSLALF